MVDILFDRDAEARSPWTARLWLGGVIAAGAVVWLYFLGWGRVDLAFHDWADITMPRLRFLQSALREGRLPLHMVDTAPLHGLTDRFLALPDVITSPQTLLLRWIDVRSFVLIDVLISYGIGVAGLLLIKRHCEWTLFTFTTVFALFAFNGHVLSHYTVGHFTWGSYFLFPLLFWFIFRFLDGEAGWRWAAGLASILGYMVLAGGQHHMTWVLIFLFVMAPFTGRRAWWLVAAAVAGVGLSAVRLLPPALALTAIDSTRMMEDALGYPSTLHLLRALIELRREHSALDSLPGNLIFFDRNYWEFNVYLGVVGFAFVVAGSWHWLRERSPRYRELVVPVMAMVALSMGSVYRLAKFSGVPILDGERITSRMFSLPLVLLLLMAGIFFDRWLKSHRPLGWWRVVALGSLAFMVLDLSASVRLLRVAESARLFPPSAISVAAATLANHPDPAYTGILLAGAAISLLTIAALTVLCVRERSRRAG